MPKALPTHVDLIIPEQTSVTVSFEDECDMVAWIHALKNTISARVCNMNEVAGGDVVADDGADANQVGQYPVKL